MKSNDKKSKNNKKHKNKFNDYTSFLNPEIVASDPQGMYTANLKNLSKTPTICKKLIVCENSGSPKSVSFLGRGGAAE